MSSEADERLLVFLGGSVYNDLQQNRGGKKNASRLKNVKQSFQFIFKF